ncbi:MAG: elongation factor P maturation arginine rhamnosyltransferase EarP [Acidobacteriota bacterium]
MAAMLWDIFCRVIDNFGDMGVCWRLSADLAQRGHQVRLWVDDASSLDWMAPSPQAVQVHAWHEAEQHPPLPGDVVVEAFGCDPPPAFVARMQRPVPPTWINLEYLSAEAYVERSHGLPSPVWSGAGAGLRKWFFYPGFTQQTGGLLREPDLLQRRDAFLASPHARSAWLAGMGAAVDRADTLFVSVFCYDSAPLPAWLDAVHAQVQRPGQPPVTVLLTPGAATRLARQWLQHKTACESLRLHELPYLPQTEFDHLLWACDLNFVRGEDSAVRALWAGKPHVWQIYEQDDGVHAGKLDAFMNRWMRDWDQDLRQSVRQLWLRWNGLGDDSDPLAPWVTLANPNGPWAQMAKNAGENLAKQVDLTTQLIAFVNQTG